MTLLGEGLKSPKKIGVLLTTEKTDYTYPESLEEKIVESLGNKIYSPYSETFFNSTDETDIEHIVSLSEAHDSGLCSASPQEKSAFASDLRNLTLASPSVNRYEKSGHDATNWLPEKKPMLVCRKSFWK